MVTPSHSTDLRVGAVVRVLWGADEIDGEIVDLYGRGPLARAQVRVAIRGADGEALDHEEFSLPLDAVRIAT